MVNPDKRKAIYLLHKAGMSGRRISRLLAISRNTVNTIITQKGIKPEVTRKDKIKIDEELLCRLFCESNGLVNRIHGKLAEQEGIVIGYSTLTRMIHEIEFSQSKWESRLKHGYIKNI